MNIEELKKIYKQVCKLEDGNYNISTISQKESDPVEYYAHTEIDEVYGMEGKWGLVDKDGNIVIKPKYIYPFIECGENYQVMLPEQTKKIRGKEKIITLKHGLIDKKGNVLIPIKYLYMEAMDNSGTYFRVVDSKTYKSGVVDKNNNIIIPFIYEFIQAAPDYELCTKIKNSYIYPDNIYQVKVDSNDSYGIYDLKLKKEIIKPKYKSMRIIDYNRFLIGEEPESCNTLIDENENIIEVKNDMEILKNYMDEVNRDLYFNKEKNDIKLKKYDLTIDDLKLRDSDEKYEYIKNYYRYYIGGPSRLGLYKEELKDFDCYKRVLEQIKKDYGNVTHLEKRYFKIEEIKDTFETDTAYSFKRVFHDFLRNNYNDYFTKYMDEYNLKEPDELYKSIYLLKNIDKFEFKDEHKELMDMFNKFAKIYHTYNNVILVPYGYNVERNRLYKDIYSVSMKNLIDLGFDKKIIEKYCKYYEDSNLYSFEEKIMNKLNTQNKMTIEEYKDYLNNAITFIENKKHKKMKG